MGKGVLGLCLFLLSLTLSLGPILWGLSAYNWDFIEVVKPESDILSRLTTTPPTFRQESIDAATGRITLVVENLPFAIRIENFSAEIYCVTCDLLLGTARLEESITIDPQSNTFTLIPISSHF